MFHRPPLFARPTPASRRDAFHEAKPLAPQKHVFLELAVAGEVAAVCSSPIGQRPVALAIEDTPLRASPVGRAPAIRTLPSGAAVLVEREQPGWVLVRAGGSEQGWLPRASVAPIGK